jgi:hypothetical protein
VGDENEFLNNEVFDLTAYLEAKRAEKVVFTATEPEPYWELHAAREAINTAIRMIDELPEGYNKPRYEHDGSHDANVDILVEKMEYLEQYMRGVGALPPKESPGDHTDLED